MKLILSSLVRFSRVSGDRSLQLDVGSGNDRVRLQLTASNPTAFHRWLLSTRSPANTDELITGATQALDISEQEARDLVDQLHGARVLIDPTQDAKFANLLDRWGRMGWRDPADFHVANYGLRFRPDDDGGETYRAVFRDLLADPGPVGEQPDHYAPKATRQALSLRFDPLPDHVTLEHVLDRAKPVNKFTGPAPAADDVMAALVGAVGVQRVVGGSLGAHQQRSYPSGGSRHPFETYVVSKGIDGIAQGAYWFDPVTRELHPREATITPEAVNNACFGKGGVVSSHICLAITCRWLRHSWKYRYSRSYRMLLLELGHMVQAINLSMRARDIDLYQCPSINDSEWMGLLGLDDDGQEGPMYVLGLGTEGRI